MAESFCHICIVVALNRESETDVVEKIATGLGDLSAESTLR